MRRLLPAARRDAPN